MDINLQPLIKTIPFHDIDELASRMRAFRWDMIHRPIEAGTFEGELFVLKSGAYNSPDRFTIEEFVLKGILLPGQSPSAYPCPHPRCSSGTGIPYRRIPLSCRKVPGESICFDRETSPSLWLLSISILCFPGPNKPIGPG